MKRILRKGLAAGWLVALGVALILGAGLSAHAEEPAQVPMYRVFNPNTMEHLYTASPNERNTLVLSGWDYEGVGWYAPAVSDVPVYRLYNGAAGDHLYTTDETERAYLLSAGWNDEGVSFYSAEGVTENPIPVYREYTPALTTGSHNYTTSWHEHGTLVAGGAWQDEGIAWYALSEGNAAACETMPQDFHYIRQIRDNTLQMTVINPIGDAPVWGDYYVQAHVWSDAHGIDDLEIYPLYPTAQETWQGTFPVSNHMESGPLHIAFYRVSGGVSSYIGEDVVQAGGMPWKNGWVYAHGKWYHYNGSGGVTEIRDDITGIPNLNDGADYPFVASDRMEMLLRANNYSSTTGYVILVNRTTHTCGVYQGSKGRWQEVFYVSVGDGAPGTPTIEGAFRVGIRMRYFDSGSYRLFYATQISGDYLFHSIAYAQTPTPERILDGRLGIGVSHGCVRMKLEDCKWIYDNIPSGTTVVVYH